MTEKIIIQGIPYDEKSSYLQGARQAPPLIRKLFHSSSTNYFAENGVDTNSPYVVDKGDFEIKEYFDIEGITARHLEDKSRIVTLGGDHSITFPIIKAFAKTHSKIDLLHFDAHPDLYDELGGDKHSHACPFARIMEEGCVSRLVQVGIRTLNTHQKSQAEVFGVEIHEMKDLDISKIPDFENPVYISLDMDAFDPAFAPGVSHHEPGGLTSRQVIEIVQNIRQTVIGADIVEYNPKRDIQDITGALCAKMLKEFLGKMLEEKEQRPE
ncbi:MAG: agmatinase [Pyrinomonadaceae bacterium]|nr:agmatinase [Pyrinomonadaceae bacterium]